MLGGGVRVSVDGLGSTPANTAHVTPASRSSVSTRSTIPVAGIPRSVTTNARLRPSPETTAPMRPTAPGPNSMRPCGASENPRVLETCRPVEPVETPPASPVDVIRR